MAKEICISSTPHETRLAILEDDQLAEIYYERENEYTLAGSIYNGRVTRVLPGMQSAFVDLGLERDAFLYVTDFIELEDQEETDELEHAAAAGQPPREIRHTNGRVEEDRSREERNGRGEQRQGGQRQREPQQPRPELSIERAEVITPVNEPAVSEAQSDETTGGRRWRGRRHRRGRGGAQDGRPGEDRMPEATGAVEEFQSATAMPAEVSLASAPVEPAIPAARAAAAPQPFVLPGESLSKYGGTTAAETPRPAAPARPKSTSKPSTLVEVPLDWDPNSGLLPGESLSRRRQPEPEPESIAASAMEPVGGSPDEVEEEEFISNLRVPGSQMLDSETVEFEESEAGESQPPSLREMEFPQESAAPEVIEQLSEEDEFEEETTDAEDGEEGSSEDEGDASASHRVDPASPTGFRLFGLGGKKKKDEPEPIAASAPVAKAAPPASSYAPGVGHIEEEVIEGEELEAPHARRHKSDENDLDDYEEQTLPAQARGGELGEMLQEAHLDARIQMRMGQTAGEEEDEAYDIVDGEEEEEETASEAQPGEPAAPGQPRRDRRDRGRRGGGRGPQGQGGKGRGPSRRSMQTSDLPIISDLLKPGQEILVQIAKEPIAKKGARITSHIALPGRFLVFMPTVSHVGVSRKIASDEERHRLKRILTHERGESSGGFIVRTAAEGASEEELRADLRFLMNMWSDIKQRSEASKSPALIYHDLSLIERILRDQVSANFSNIWVDSEADYERIVRFLNRFSPSLVRRVKLYTKETPLFEHFGIQDEISKALRSKVWLKSGGSIVINQTEALVAIDINTGKYVGKSARLEDTIVKTNLDAVPEIVRQIRLRDLGGIIVIDFIDMDERKNRYKVLAALEEALKADRAPTKVLQFNDFGLVAITRKRVKQSLERTLSVPCPTCQATSMVKSPTTVCNEIWVELRKMRKHFEGQDVMLRVHPETVKVLKASNARWLSDFEDLVGKNVLVKSDATLHPEQFDIQG